VSGVSYVITVYNKRPYLERVADAIARQRGDFEREVIFVDDGSTDGSAELAESLAQRFGEAGVVIRQRNSGAAVATNAGARRARFPWLKLVDGDDVLVPEATRCLLDAATRHDTDLAWCELGEYPHDAVDPLAGHRPGEVESTLQRDGLAHFIRINTGNSSSILVSAHRYANAGGCDPRLISPDSMLFLRLFLVGDGAWVRTPLALIPTQAPGRLSGQQRRSRYESVRALYYLVSEYPELSREHARLAYRRAMSRAYTYHRHFGGLPVLTPHFLRYALSKLYVPADPAPGIWKALAAFTEDGRSERPQAWLPGALRDDAEQGV
jgi:glycosyltransferase involved in cell wall biosynthesis